jgi:hypothetical protein
MQYFSLFIGISLSISHTHTHTHAHAHTFTSWAPGILAAHAHMDTAVSSFYSTVFASFFLAEKNVSGVLQKLLLPLNLIVNREGEMDGQCVDGR